MCKTQHVCASRVHRADVRRCTVMTQRCHAVMCIEAVGCLAAAGLVT
jgi:hypothetical protein